MGFLLDTNVLSELRKGERADPGVLRWIESVRFERQAISVLSIGEIRRGILIVQKRDPDQARALKHWLEGLVKMYREETLLIGTEVAWAWGNLNAKRTFPSTEGLLAATAKVHRLCIATRNIRDFEGAGVDVVNPFAA